MKLFINSLKYSLLIIFCTLFFAQCEVGDPPVTAQSLQGTWLIDQITVDIIKNDTLIQNNINNNGGTLDLFEDGTGSFSILTDSNTLKSPDFIWSFAGGLISIDAIVNELSDTLLLFNITENTINTQTWQSVLTVQDSVGTDCLRVEEWKIVR